ncbi:hypothetical protein [Kineococcus sp. SYSU DK004]|uniref:hypothetical protein n=1 Tax=Kineococcus sp. SYSU DK004 TaxID=3383125 RepID=UPI003D7C6B87
MTTSPRPAPFPPPAQPAAPGPAPGAAHAVLWTGIGSLVLLGTGLGWLAAIVALVTAPRARRAVAAAVPPPGTPPGTPPAGRGLVTAGVACAWATLALTLLLVLLVVVWAAALWQLLQGVAPAPLDVGGTVSA